MATREKFIRSMKKLMDDGDLRIEAAFLASIQGMVDEIVLAQVIAALDRGDIEAAVNAVDVDRAAFAAFEEAIRGNYSAVGTETMKLMGKVRDMDGSAIVVRFDVRNERAEDWLNTKSSELITGNLVPEQRQTIRDVLTSGMERGDNPRTTALDMAGRVVGGKRQGGVIGLTGPQARTVNWVRDALSSGDEEALRRYLTLKRRDKRLDRQVMKLIQSGKPANQELRDKVTGRLSDSYLKLRADVIARTESMASLNAAQEEAFAQALEKSGNSPQFVTREWSAARDKRTRDTHGAMHGQKVQGMTTPFTTPTGYQLMRPGDSSLGAPASEIANCRCIQYIEYDYFEGRG
ncbi:phage minor head protein [Haematobacter massiliensis]|uniref:phage minor head protein n=1 Tax=Haematobacter massiliensis TaxID=195105 RepID=UPI000691922A|nr:phage minor head protein [Haematobacter massiliensis]OWJ82713.1 head morphogenesis protein [Haematobacter massiliensis]